ncbi:MAG: 2-hydroxy-acid oxidase [Hyphomicrobiales bacterium]|nr:FAD-binding protein [Hyphomicrobiales bacterium]PCJ93499.1 MAG: 2-hydroxy-acid oxidase [Hyphomicrobiales bacterium]
MTLISPKNEAELVEAVSKAVDNKSPLSIIGNGSRSGLGRAVQNAQTLTTSNLTGIILLEPAEMIFSARAGTPVSVVVDALAKHNQMMTFEPMDHRKLYGTDAEPTIGAVAAGNISGPRRISAGAARDSLIGVRMVNGRAQMIKNGGRVMKNVTGLDLVKLVSGSWGTLGVLSEVTFKVLPKAEKSATLVLSGLDDATAVEALCQAMTSQFEATGTAHMPAGVGDANAQTFIRLEGFEKQLSYRFDRMRQHLSAFGKAEEMTGDDSEALWRDIRDVVPLAEPADRAIWKISVAPTKGAQFVQRFREKQDFDAMYDWSGGLIWIALDPATNGDAGANALRAIVKELGGHATLIRGSQELRARIDVFQPLSAPLAKITRGIKTSFDPDGIFNSGLMYPGV